MGVRFSTAVRPLCVVALLPLAACKTVEKKDQPVVRSLEIHGAEQVKAGDIKKKILTSQTGWIPLISRKEYFDRDIWRTDLRRIERFYRERGYYQAEVVDDRITPKGENGVALDVQVREGTPTLIAEVKISGLDGLPADQRERVLATVQLKNGDIFIEDRWEGLKEQLAAALRAEGYAMATVEGQAFVDVATQRAKIEVQAAPGIRYHFGELKLVTGENPRVEGWRVLEQAEAEVKPGAWYSEQAMADAQARVFKMGVFGAVKVRHGDPDPNTGTVPVIVNVRESPFHQIRVGVGAQLDQARNEFRVLGEYTDRDFFGGMRRFNLKGTAGYAFIPTAYASATSAPGAKNGPVADITTELDQPRILYRDLGAQLKLEVERGIEPAYSFYGARGKLGASYTPTPNLSFTLSYNFEVYRLQEGAVTLGGQAPELLFGCPETCVLSYLEQRAEYDKRDDKQEPKRGYYLALGLQEGGGPLGGSFTYFRITPEARGYVSFLEDASLTLAGRIRMGSLNPASGNPLDSPIVARFYAGGGSSMRGFSARRLSPQTVVENVTGPDKEGFTGYTVPIGGNGLFESSWEARYNVWGPLVVATFLDTGFVTSESLEVSPGFFARNMLYAVGAGVRYRTPVGPIRLDFAYRLPVGPPLQVYQPDGASFTYASEGTCFGLGHKPNLTGAGAPEGPCVLNLSIGEAF